MSEASKLQTYSIGIVAANKPLSSKQIEVTPIEDLPMGNGELSDNTLDSTSKAKDTEGASYETRVPTTMTVTATWLPLGYGNRLTAPDVRRGERVILYRFADQDKFWWVTQGQDMRLRKLETVIWGISATKDEAAEPSPDNMYWLECSSHKGLIHLHTSKANGEPFAYDWQLNVKDGVFIFQDDDGQRFSLDSKERIWRIENRDGSYLEINKREITEYAPDKITLKSKDIVLQAGHDITHTAGNTISSTAGTDIIGQAGNNVSYTAGGQFLVTAAMAIFNAFTLVKKALATMSTIRAGTTDSGTGGISVGKHTHREQGDGQLVSDPIDNSGG